MSCWGTRAQQKHLALEALGRGWCGKSPSGAEVGRRPALGGPARGRGRWPRFELACSRAGSAGPTRRARLRDRCATREVGGEFSQAQLHGRRLSRPALEVPGPGRRERSDRRTRRVAGASTCVTMGIRREECPFPTAPWQAERAARVSARRREGYPPEGARPRSGLDRVARSRSDAPKHFRASRSGIQRVRVDPAPNRLAELAALGDALPPPPVF